MTSAARSMVPVIATVLFVALAGCAAIEEIAQRLDAGAAGTPPPPPKIKPKHVITPPPPKPKPRIALTAGRGYGLPAQPEFDPRSLIGLKPAQAIATLGDPVTVLERSPSMVWRYNAKGCALDLFFYLDLGANTFRVLAYDMKAGTSSDGAARACLGRFRAAADGR